MPTFTILLGGDMILTQRLKQQITDTAVIAADSGIRHAQTIGLVPLLWVGDFDSIDEKSKEYYKFIPQTKFSPRKSMTDGELAVQSALERGANRLILCGAFGGERSDHTLFHMMMAISLAEKNIPSLLTSGIEEAWPLIAGTHFFDLPKGCNFSIITFSKLEGLSIHDACWCLHDKDITFGSSLTMSNISEEKLSISLRKGRGLLIAHYNEKIPLKIQPNKIALI